MSFCRLHAAFLLIGSLILSDLVVLAHVASHLPPVHVRGLERFAGGVGEATGSALEATLESRDAGSTCRCVFHQRKREQGRWESKGLRPDDASRTSAGSEHDAEACSLCRSVYTARTHAFPVLSWLVAREAVTEYIASCYIFPTLDGHFVSVVSERGPPV